MAFSLSNWFKGKPTTSAPDSETIPAPQELTASPAPAAPPQHGSVRTVTPSATPQQPRATVNAREAQQRAPISLPTSKLPVSGKVTPVQPPRKVSFPGGGVAPESVRVAAAPAYTPPAPDISVSLEIGDFIDRLPPNFVQSGSHDRHKKVEFPAAELYSDLSKGRASVPASVIYARCPEIFTRPVTQTEDVEVPLPLQKLVEQMGAALSTRTDQVGEENVGEIETPFLQVAMEDNARVPSAAGTTAGPIRPPGGPRSDSALPANRLTRGGNRRRQHDPPRARPAPSHRANFDDHTPESSRRSARAADRCAQRTDDPRQTAAVNRACLCRR